MNRVGTQHDDAELSGLESKDGLEARISAIGDKLASCFQRVLNALPGAPHRPQELARFLSINKDLSSRIVGAVAKKDPIAVAHAVPGPEPLRRLLKASSRKGVSTELISEAEQVVREFDQLIRSEAGDRIALEGIISAWLPEARERFELLSKQALFRGMSQLKGAMAATELFAAIVHPSEGGEHHDGVELTMFTGLYRTRPGKIVRFGSRRKMPPTDASPQSLDGRAVGELSDILLEDFCSQPAPELDVISVEDTVHYVLGGDGVGPNTAVDLALATVNRSVWQRYRPRDSMRKSYVSADIETPVRALIFDVILHEDVFPDSEPQLLIYDTGVEGVADPNDIVRDMDRYEVGESIQFLGRGISGFRCARLPRYVELLRYVMGKLNWDEGRFRGYRCEIQCPMYGSQVVMAFDRPGAPE